MQMGECFRKVTQEAGNFTYLVFFFPADWPGPQTYQKRVIVHEYILLFLPAPRILPPKLRESRVFVLVISREAVGLGRSELGIHCIEKVRKLSVGDRCLIVPVGR